MPSRYVVDYILPDFSSANENPLCRQYEESRTEYEIVLLVIPRRLRDGSALSRVLI